MKLAPAIPIHRHLTGMVFQVIDEHFAREFLAYLHGLETLIAVRQQDRTPGIFLIFDPLPRPSDTIRKVKIIPLLTIREFVPGHQ